MITKHKHHLTNEYRFSLSVSIDREMAIFILNRFTACSFSTVTNISKQSLEYAQFTMDSLCILYSDAFDLSPSSNSIDRYRNNSQGYQHIHSFTPELMLHVCVAIHRHPFYITSLGSRMQNHCFTFNINEI